MRLRSVFFAVVLAVLALPGAPARAEVVFPDTPVGRHARAWFAAFNADEAAMRAFYPAHIAAGSLKERPVEVRLAGWRDLRAQAGTITAERVQSGTPLELEVLATSANGGPVRVKFRCEEAPPHGLLGASIEQGEGGDDAPAFDAGPAPRDEAELAARIGATMDSLARAGKFSGAVLLDRAGTKLVEKAWGMASVAEKRANTVSTRFNLGSINKQFTAACIHRLVSQGKLTLDDPISRWLPEYPNPSADRITIRMLLRHRGGVPDFFNARYRAADPDRLRKLSDWFAFVRDEPLTFEPGTSQRYSNGGYILLGMIIEKVSGMDYYEYVRRNVYAIAGMERSDSYPKAELPAGSAIGYTRGEPGSTAPAAPNTPELPWHGNSAGGGYSTLGDLLRFANALRAGKLRNVEQQPAGPPGFAAAGGSPGCNAYLHVEGPYTLVVLGNLDPPCAEGPGEAFGRWLEAMAGGGGPRVKVGAGAK